MPSANWSPSTPNILHGSTPFPTAFAPRQQEKRCRPSQTSTSTLGGRRSAPWLWTRLIQRRRQENRLTGKAPYKVHAHLPRDAHHFGQGLPQQRRFVAIARRRHERRDHVAMAIAEGDDFVALHLLVPAEAEVVAALFRRRRRAVAVNDRRIEEAVLMKPRHRTGENGVDAAVVHPPPPDAINARVVSFQAVFAILVDRQLLPLAAQIHVLQNVVEYFVEAELRCRTAGAWGEVRQDKLLELREFQLRRNRLPALISSHSGPPESWTLPDSLAPAENPGPGRLTAKFDRLQKPATS